MQEKVNDFTPKVRRPRRFSGDHRSLSAYSLFFFFFLPCGSFARKLPPSSAKPLIADGTPVKLQLAQTISSAHARLGDRLEFVVVEDVVAGGFLVIPAGTIARGSVIKVERKHFLGLGGKVSIKLNSVELVNGARVKLRARRAFKGSSHTERMAAEMIVTGFIYMPAALIFLLSRGRDCTVLKGTEVTAYTDGDSWVQSAGLAKAKESVSTLGEMIAFLPPRVLDSQGRKGDMINLIFIARKKDLQRAFKLAGWVKVDKLTPAIIWHLLWHREHYVKLPMDTFYVFGRAQDYSYALPDPAATVTRRHHLRIWKTDYKMNGLPIWVGAATHDVAIKIKMRKLRVLHRIDPDVDAEREFIAQDLAETHLIAQVKYFSSSHPVFEAQTVDGEAYHSDGRILLLDLNQENDSTVATIQGKDHVLEGPLLSFSK
ncbi:MAG TPA: LssY C-terminal domain-containing protein [Terriglobia bacterium]|nr:LssY C-terminal domain-containing protein [Terriglobia bacterium]